MQTPDEIKEAHRNGAIIELCTVRYLGWAECAPWNPDFEYDFESGEVQYRIKDDRAT